MLQIDMLSLCKRRKYYWAFATKTFKTIHCFLQYGGAVDCTVTGCKRYSANLAQHGLEVPCSLILRQHPKKFRS